MMKNRQPDGCREVLKLKIAIVTGASSGMGREFALQIPQLYKNLDELWVVARRTDRLKNLQEQVKIPVRIFDGDMQRDYIFEKLQRELDRRQADVRMLVNAAGYGKIGNVSDIDLKEQCGMVDLNCTALTRMTGICLPYLSKGSRIVNLASAASFCAQPGFCVYAASKAYVLRFSQGLAAELKKRGILVTAVCPGPVRTEFFDRAGALAIFTDTTISLSSRLRQRPDHYTIRAGRNLPDKEFRYLRTVIVTAAVYWGFNSTLLLSMTSPLNLPAPGRCQAVYWIFRFGTALCFC